VAVLPQGPLTTRVLAPKSTEFVGTVPLTVTFKVDGDAERRVNATVSLERLSKVVVARRPLGRFKPIDPEDIEVRAVDAAGLPFDCITDPAAVIGKRTRRLVETGAALRPDMVESPPLVKSGTACASSPKAPGCASPPSARSSSAGPRAS